MKKIEYENDFEVIQEFPEHNTEIKEEKDLEKLQQLYNIFSITKDDEI